MDDLLKDEFLVSVGIARQLEDLQFESHGVESAASILHLEALIGVRLPENYRNFLSRFGGGRLAESIAICRIPTPFGHHTISEVATIEDILNTVTSETIPRNLLCIGKGRSGLLTCIAIAGIDHGAVYAFDSSMRYYWSADDVAAKPLLEPSIKEFFRLRDNNELPYRPWGYENCYDLAGSFDELVLDLKRR